MLEVRLIGAFEVKVDGKPITTFGRKATRDLLVYLALQKQPQTRTHIASILYGDYINADSTSEELTEKEILDQSKKKPRDRGADILAKALSELKQCIGSKYVFSDEESNNISLRKELFRIDFRELENLIAVSKWYQSKILARDSKFPNEVSEAIKDEFESQIGVLQNQVDGRIGKLSSVKLPGRKLLPSNPVRYFPRKECFEKLISEFACVSARIITICGQPGIGKTSFAIDFINYINEVTRVDESAGMPIVYVDLSEVEPEQSVWEAITLQSGEFVGHQDSKTRVLNAFGENNILLVLDDCQKILKAVKEVVNDVLRLCRNVVVLTTSQQRVNREGERVIKLDPLPDSDSYNLLLYHIEMSNPNWRPGLGDPEALAEITRRIEGIPLALRLIATVIADRSARSVLDSFETSLLNAEQGSASGHHVTLQDALDHAIIARTEGECNLLLRLSVFRGSFDLDAVVDVCEVDPAEAQDILATLVRASLIEELRVEDLPADRWRVREVIRITCWQRISLEHDALRDRHLAHYQKRLLETAAPRELDSSHPATKLRSDADNIRAVVMEGMRSKSKLEKVVKFTLSSVNFWDVNGLYDDFYKIASYFRENFDELESVVSSSELCSVLNEGGRLAGWGDRFTLAGQLFEKVAAVYERDGIYNHWFEFNHVYYRIVTGDYSKAVEKSKILLERSDESEFLGGSINAHYGLALAFFRLGDYEKAEFHMGKSSELCKLNMKENEYQKVFNDYNKILIYLVQGKLEWPREMLDQFRKMENVGEDFVSNVSYLEGLYFCLTGNASLALGLHEQSLAYFKSVGQFRGVAQARLSFGRAAILTGNYQGARECLEAAVEYFSKLSDAWSTALCYERLAVLHWLLKDRKSSKEMLDKALQWREKYGTPTLPIDTNEIEGLKKFLSESLQ